MAAYDRRTVKGNVAYTITLASSVVGGDTAISVSDGSTLPDGSAGPFTITLDPGGSGEEKVKIATRTGNTLTVATLGRGYDGTSAASHASGVKVFHTISAVDLDEANQLVHALLTGGTTGQVATVDTSLTPPIKLAAAPVASFNGGTGAIAQTNGYGIAGANANPPAPAVSLTTVSSFITSDVALSVSTPANVTSVSLAAGTWQVFGQAAIENGSAANAGGCDLWLSTTSAGGVALGAMSAVIAATTNPNAFRFPFAFACAVTPGATTTYFLNVEFGQAGPVKAAGSFETAHVVSGLTAVRIA